MMLGAPNMLQVSGTPVPIDKTLNQAYINAIKKHIELLEYKKRKYENEYMFGETPSLAKGIILGINYAIEQLYEDINQFKEK